MALAQLGIALIFGVLSGILEDQTNLFLNTLDLTVPSGSDCRTWGIIGMLTTSWLLDAVARTTVLQVKALGSFTMVAGSMGLTLDIGNIRLLGLKSWENWNSDCLANHLVRFTPAGMVLRSPFVTTDVSTLRLDKARKANMRWA